jgi:2-iminobutanoate/2-iminopropanoate deaminase
VSRQAVGGSRPAGAYSPGIIAEGRFVYVSGQGPLRDGVMTGGTTAEQTTIALENLAAVLREAGASLSDVVRCGVFLANITHFAAMNEAYGAFFSGPGAGPLPARTTVGVGLPAGMLVEIDCVAVLPASTQR